MITVQLGDFVFADFEVPESMPWGGEQLLSIHQMVGGKRVIDAMGRSDAPLEWSGRIRGSEAVSRARQLDAMRIAGKPLVLTWSEFRYTVVIKRFTPVFEQAFEVPYTISCEVASDDATPVSPGQGPSVDDMMSSDADDADDMADDIDADDDDDDETDAEDGAPPGGLSALVANVQSAVSAVSNFASATREEIASVLAPIQAVQAQVGSMIATATAAVNSVSSLGGVVAGIPAVQSAQGLIGQVAAMTRLPMLYDLNSLMGRMTTNLAAVRASGSTIVQAGGDLLHLATQAYGDPNEWPTIALANDLTDPVLTGVNSVLIPPDATGADGVLQA